MSLVVCMKAGQAIVMAADSRGTVGDPRGLTAINDTYIKIFPMGNLGIGLVGASEMGNTLLDELNKKNVASITDFDQAISKIVEESAKCFNQWFGNIAPDKRPVVIATVAGHRKHPNGSHEPMIYMLVSQTNFAPQLFGHMPCLIGVPQYAVYLAHRYYDPSISIEQAKALAEYLIAETASQDPKVGGPIRIAEINVTGYRELTTKEVEQIHSENEKLNQNLRKFFLERRPV
ncbi:MAG: hypothetical protein Q7T57_05595 [Dehalococcoidales bacterium]|nr:hypothetical protein [Dehalococcoidales bacterium]